MEKLVPPQCLVGSIELGHPWTKSGSMAPNSQTLQLFSPMVHVYGI